MKEPIIETDVLVIGSGGAASFAAVAASERGADVLMVDRGIFGRSGATVTGGHTCCAAIGPNDSPQLHFKDTIEGGYLLGNQKLVEIYVKEAPRRILEVDSWGADFLRKKDGNFWLITPPAGQNIERSVHYGYRTGQLIMRGCRRELNRRQIKRRDNTIITSLLGDTKGIIGATALDILSGEFLIVKAKAVVLGSGGWGRLWSKHTVAVEATGDVLGMAYQKGADLIDMEFQQFIPANIDPLLKVKGTLLANIPPWRAKIREKAKFVNALGEEFIQKYDPVRLLYTTRDIRSRAIYNEIKAGRGTKEGGIYLDLTNVPSDIIEEELGPRFPGSFTPWLRRIGFDLSKTPMQIAVQAHYSMGGLRISEKAETTIPGLYAAGEVTGGVDGANRLGCNALTEIMVFGRIAGDNAAQHAATANLLEPEKYEVSAEKNRVFQYLNNPSGNISPIQIRKKLGSIMWECAGVSRDDKSLRQALCDIEEMREKSIPQMRLSSGNPVYNWEWLEAISLPRRLDVAETIVTAALFRKESRGAHWRDDYPKRDDRNWLKNIAVRMAASGRPQIDTLPVVTTEFGGD